MILITGGAGYIGSCANAFLNALGIRTIVLDSLIYGHKEALDYKILDSRKLCESWRDSRESCDSSANRGADFTRERERERERFLAI